MRSVLGLSITLTCVGLAGCGGSGGLAGGSSTGDLDTAAATVAGTWAVIDISGDGVVRYQDQPPAFGAAGRLVFRAVDPGTVVIGTISDSADPRSFARQEDETLATSTVGRTWVAVTELTRGQWRTLMGGDSSGDPDGDPGDEPWVQPGVLDLGGADPADLTIPAAGIGPDQALTLLAVANGRIRGGALRLPSEAEWIRACRGDTADAFAWGNATDRATTARSAWTLEALGQRKGPQPVGGLAANALGLVDMHGNLWELLDDGRLKGGSWGDTIAQARAGNRAMDNAPIPDDVGHPLVGVRLILDPR
jgi:formylglycine-generating enzyme required for sulfatase activity